MIKILKHGMTFGKKKEIALECPECFNGFVHTVVQSIVYTCPACDCEWTDKGI